MLNIEGSSVLKRVDQYLLETKYCHYQLKVYILNIFPSDLMQDLRVWHIW